MLSPEIQVMLAPARAYATYARSAEGGAWPVLRRLLFIALVQGVAIAMVATHTVAAPLVASVTVCWTTALAVQLIAAAVFLLSARSRPITVSRALDLLFLGHAPWTLWLLACAGALTWASSVRGTPWIAVLTMIVPAALTVRILTGFAAVVLGLDARRARRLAVLHQAIVWTALVGFFVTAVQLWPRILGVVRS